MFLRRAVPPPPLNLELVQTTPHFVKLEESPFMFKGRYWYHLALQGDPQSLELVEACTRSVTPIFEKALSSMRKSPISPTLSDKFKGSSGSFFLLDLEQDSTPKIAIFKPASQELGAPECPKPGTELRKPGIEPKEGVFRECLAYLVCKQFGVLPTLMAKLPITPDNLEDPEWGSVQKFERGESFIDLTAEDQDSFLISLYPDELQKLTIIDIMLWNADRNLGNVLVYKDDEAKTKLVPIDHGLIAPKDFDSPAKLCWMDWRISRAPFTKENLKAIATLDFEKIKLEIQKNFPVLPPEILGTLQFSITLLKQGAALGLTPFQIGVLMIEPNKSTFWDRHESIIKRLYDKASQKKSDFQKELESFIYDYAVLIKKEGRDLFPTEIISIMKDKFDN